MLRRQPLPTLFPYTTLFRSRLLRAEIRGRTGRHAFGGETFDVLGKRDAEVGELCPRPRLPVAVIHKQHVRRLDVDRKSTRLNSSHANISYAVFCLKKKKNEL